MNYLCFVYTIHVENIRTRSFHGCLPEEGVIGGDYKTDVWIELMDNYRITKDALEETVDYGLVTQVVINEMSIRSKLVETVCERITNNLFDSFSKIKSVKVRVCRICPPIEGDVENVSVEIKKER